MVLHHFGNTDFTEMELAEIMKSSTDLDTPGAAGQRRQLL